MLGLSDFIDKATQTIVKLVGWSPVGKRVNLHIDESSDITQLGKSLSGTIVKVVRVVVSEKYSISKDCPIIQLDSEFNIPGINLNKILAVPRHRGLGVFQLPFSCFAAYIIPVGNMPEHGIVRFEESIAIWSISLRG